MICPVCQNEMEAVLDVFDPINITAVEDHYCTRCHAASTTNYKLAGDIEIVETRVTLP